MKKFIAFSLALSLILALCGCKSSTPSSGITIADYIHLVSTEFSGTDSMGPVSVQKIDDGYSFYFSTTLVSSDCTLEFCGGADSKKCITSVLIYVHDCFDTDYFNWANVLSLLLHLEDVSDTEIDKLTVDFFLYCCFQQLSLFSPSALEGDSDPILRIFDVKNAPQTYDGWTYSFEVGDEAVIFISKHISEPLDILDDYL